MTDLSNSIHEDLVQYNFAEELQLTADVLVQDGIMEMGVNKENTIKLIIEWHKWYQALENLDAAAQRGELKGNFDEMIERYWDYCEGYENGLTFEYETSPRYINRLMKVLKRMEKVYKKNPHDDMFKPGPIGFDGLLDE
ncbi:MAG: hypothetical protein FWG65_11740 [Turicibacter sp.]|nr:hypothetical protein [Turicibacter sp.]